MAAEKKTKKTKKKTKAALRKELSRIKKLLKDESFRAQAIELLKALDHPHHWEAVTEMIDIEVHKDIAKVDNVDMELLALLPESTAGLDETKQRIQQLWLRSESVLRARAAPYVRRLVLQGRTKRPWPYLSELATLAHLRDLDIQYTPLGDAAFLEQLGLQRLKLQQTSLTALPSLPTLEVLILSNIGAIQLGDLPALRELHVQRSPSLVNWKGVGVSSKLELVQVVQDNELTTLDVLGNAVAAGSPLREVTLAQAKSLRSINGLRDAEQLVTFVTLGAPGLKSIRGLASKPKLEALTLRSSAVEDLTPLAGATSLRSLDLTGCHNAKNIEAIFALPELRVVALAGTPFTPEQFPPELLPHVTWAPRPNFPALAARPRWQG